MGPLVPSSSVASLPEDCLIIIIQLLGQNRSALYALLQVSRQFFRLTVPAIYKSPFRMLESKREAWTFPERTLRQVLLLQLFLKAIQIKQTHSLSLNAQKHRPRRTERRPWRREEQQHQQKQRQQQQSQHGATVPAAITCATATFSLPSDPQSQITSSMWSGSTKKSLRFVVPLPSTLTNKRREWTMPRRRLISLPLSKKESNVKSSSSSSSSPLSPPFAPCSPSSQEVSEMTQAQFAAETDNNRSHICPCASPSSSSLSTLGAQRRQGRAAKAVKSFFSMPGMYAGWWSSSPSSRTEQDPDLAPSRCSLCNDAPNKQHLQLNQQYHLSDEQDFSAIAANGPPTLRQHDWVSDSNNSDEDGAGVDEAYYMSDDNTSLSDFSDSDNDHDDQKKNGYPASTPWPCAPDLGPFSPPRPSHTRGHWPSVFPRSSSETRQDADQDQCRPEADSEQLMTDYLHHYVEHDHPRLARQLSFIFPSIPSDVFEHLSPSTLSGSSSSSPQSSMSSNHSVLHLLQSFQQPQKNTKTIEMAQATRSKIERDLLQHSPQRIKTLCISAPRFHTILQTLQVESTPPDQGTWEDKKPYLRPPTSSFSSLFSFLSTSPFSTPSSASSVSTWSSVSSSSVSSSSAHSSRSSTASLSYQWNLPRISGKLSRLSRLELFDVHYEFDLEAVIDFLQTHDQIYGTIREIKVGGPDDLGRSTPSGLIRILQSLKRLKVLDMTDWREAIKYLDMIPTKHLETLLLGNVRMTTLNSGGSTTGTETEQQSAVTEDQEDPQIRTLKRCRRLKELRMPVLVDNLFEWAVQDRKRRQRLVGQWVYGPEPVHIQVVHLSGSNTGPLVSTLVDVADAFRDSLQTLQSTSWSDMAETLSCCQPLTWNWCLPRLQVLDLQGEIACRFKIQALEHCPELRVLRLSLPHSVLPSPSTGTRGRTDNESVEGDGSIPLEYECSGQRQYTSLADLFTPRSLGVRRSILPKLQELSIAGEWGLDDSSLLGMAEAVPTLTRLSLLRCEGLSAAGLAHAVPSFRVLYWLEVNKAWRSEFESVVSISNTGSRVHIEFS